MHRFGDINFAESRQDRFQQVILVFHDDEEPSIVTEEFNASSERRLSIHCEFVRVEQNNALEDVAAIGIDVSFCKEFQLFANEFVGIVITYI